MKFMSIEIIYKSGAKDKHLLALEDKAMDKLKEKIENCCDEKKIAKQATGNGCLFINFDEIASFKYIIND